MARTDELLNLTDIAKLAGVNRTTAQNWHKGKGKGKSPKDGGAEEALPPLPSVAKAMKVETPEADDKTPRYPRSVVVALLKAVGYMDEDGNPVEEIQKKGPGRWSPVKPTVDPNRAEQPDPDSGRKPFSVSPGTGGRYRYYVPHAWSIAGFGSEVSFTSSRSYGRAPEQDGTDELGRPFWWLETLEKWKEDAPERQARRYAGRRPDGYTAEGEPFRLLPGDNYYARKAAESQGRDLP
ncbi:hypothetical protein [Streptomyces sp. CAU 1734]|uniref:hypothetical protein n=1 Tax=Streptomyces sp. CAU 1734 TaxID=3140360 RepID=UPI00326083A0